MIVELNQVCASCALLLWFLTDFTSAFLQNDKRSPFLDAKMFPKDAFPTPTFDEAAPICTFDREPCGFYSFTSNGNLSFKWIKSWCRCAAEQECAFDRMDMRMRVFRHSCVATNRTFVKTNEEQSSKRKHRHAHRRHHKHSSGTISEDLI